MSLRNKTLIWNRLYRSCNSLRIFMLILLKSVRRRCKQMQFNTLNLKLMTRWLRIWWVKFNNRKKRELNLLLRTCHSQIKFLNLKKILLNSRSKMPLVSSIQTSKLQPRAKEVMTISNFNIMNLLVWLNLSHLIST